VIGEEMAKKKGEHYVDNAKLCEELTLWRNQYLKAKENDEPPPQMSDYLGETILQIATRLSFRPNFANYTYRDEMVSDGIENCIRYCHNFNPEKSSNAFAYITQILWWAFLRRIEAEKKQFYLKYKCMEEAGVHGLYSAVKNKKDLHENDPQRQFLDHLQLSALDIENIEKKVSKKSTPKKKTSKKRDIKGKLDEFIEDD
jgi:hypothetical protein